MLCKTSAVIDKKNLAVLPQIPRCRERTETRRYAFSRCCTGNYRDFSFHVERFKIRMKITGFPHRPVVLYGLHESRSATISCFFFKASS